jgi:hypothetical protein
VEKSKSKQMPYVRLLLFLAWPAGKHSLHWLILNQNLKYLKLIFS